MLYLGGMWTGGLVNPLFDKREKRGILAELIADHKSLGSWGGFNGESFGYENMKRLLEEKLYAAGGEALYQTQFARLIVEDGRAAAVAVENKDGRTIYSGKVIIDCTGRRGRRRQRRTAYYAWTRRRSPLSGDDADVHDRQCEFQAENLRRPTCADRGRAA